jgi:hypothetical protein
MNKLLGYITYGLAFIGLGLITIGVPVGYMIGEYVNHGGPYYIPYSMFGGMLLIGSFLMMPLYFYFEIWRDEQRALGGRDADE